MKKHLIISFFVVSCMILFSSCIVLTKTETASTRNVHGIGVIQAPTVATLDVSQTKVTELFTIKAKKKFFKAFDGGLFKKNTNTLAMDKMLESAKVFAVAKLLSKHNADVLIEPRYAFETLSTNKTSTFNVIVSGYPATYKNFRPAVPADTAIFKIRPALIIEPERMGSTLETE